MDEDRVSKGLADIIDFVKTQTDADRAIVVYEGLGCCHGFGQEKIIWEEADLSLKMLATLVEKGESVMMKDVAAEPEYAERTTAVLAGLGSVLFVPVKNEFNYTRGFLYLDQIARTTFLDSGFFQRVERYVSEVLEPAVHCKTEDVTWKQVAVVQWLPSSNF